SVQIRPPRPWEARLGRASLRSWGARPGGWTARDRVVRPAPDAPAGRRASTVNAGRRHLAMTAAPEAAAGAGSMGSGGPRDRLAPGHRRPQTVGPGAPGPHLRLLDARTVPPRARGPRAPPLPRPLAQVRRGHEEAPALPWPRRRGEEAAESARRRLHAARALGREAPPRAAPRARPARRL